MQIIFSGPLGSLSSLIVILKIELLKPVLGVVAGAGHRWTWFGHVSRSSGLANTILQGTVKGKRKRGGQKRWEDNIKEWTGMDFASSIRAAENRTRWKGIAANSSVVPRRPSKVMG